MSQPAKPSPTMLDCFPIIDQFNDDRPAGRVIRSSVPGCRGQVTRLGIDQERSLSIDHGALRIQPLIQPGWQRAALVYGPFQRQPGLMYAVTVLNGHNASSTGGLTQAFRSRLKSWMLGAHTHPIRERLVGLVRYPRKTRLMRQVQRWYAISQKDHSTPIKNNLALGWYPSESPSQPDEQGNAFIVHASGPKNAELWLRASQHSQLAIHSLQNVPVWYIVILRERGAAYYAASLPNANQLTCGSEMRPLGIDPFEMSQTVYAGLHQSVLGEIGFQADTRVSGVQIDRADEFSAWYGSAHAAGLSTAGDQGAVLTDNMQAETGGNWQVLPYHDHTLATLDPRTPSGLIHALFNNTGGLVWRYLNAQNYWRVRITWLGAYLECIQNGQVHAIASQAGRGLLPDRDNSLQIIDDGMCFYVALNGQTLFEGTITDERLGHATGTGLIVPARSGHTGIHHFEAHPRAVSLPACFQLSKPEWLSDGKLEAWDTFRALPGELHNRFSDIVLPGDSAVPQSVAHRLARTWRRELGTGRMEVRPSGGAQVLATPQQPNPGRTAYTILWDHPNYADLHIEVLPPGSQRGQGHKCRAGVIFWQDPDNYLITSTWLDDCYQGASLSSFFYLQGFEDVYDAIWTNVGPGITWGQPYHLRAVFDGLVYQVLLDDKPVLYRSLTDVYPSTQPLAIQRVGIVANWEWGNDTGSIFRCFEARTQAEESVPLAKTKGTAAGTLIPNATTLIEVKNRLCTD